VADIITSKELKERLSSGRQLRIKHGIDATSPYLHLGHAANLWKLRQLQEAGHKAVILFGDTTTRVGDPTGKSKTRPILSEKEIAKNISFIKKQIESILLTDKKVYETRCNSEWYAKTNASEFLEIASLVTHARLIERDMFQERIREKTEITISEILYPILQGYDSVKLKSDMTVIGSDQIFNEHMGRMLQEKFGQPPQIIVALKIVPGLDGGEKMSKSANNFIAITDKPKDKFGKMMTLRDELIGDYLESYTDVSAAEIKEIKEDSVKGKNPMEAKLFLAEKLVTRYHGAEQAKKIRNEFTKVFSQKNNPVEMKEFKTFQKVWSLLDLLVVSGLANSKTEARRLVSQGGVRIDGEKIKPNVKSIELKSESVFKVGKLKFLKVVIIQ